MVIITTAVTLLLADRLSQRLVGPDHAGPELAGPDHAGLNPS